MDDEERQLLNRIASLSGFINNGTHKAPAQRKRGRNYVNSRQRKRKAPNKVYQRGSNVAPAPSKLGYSYSKPPLKQHAGKKAKMVSKNKSAIFVDNVGYRKLKPNVLSRVDEEKVRRKSERLKEKKKKRIMIQGIWYKRKGNALVNAETSQVTLPKSVEVDGETFLRSDDGLSLIRQKPNISLKVKHKPCMFYVKFGVCERQDECKYVHDPSTIETCQRFLKGKCHDSDCLLPHRTPLNGLPTCCYFLRGTCNRDPCPYRHVYVNPNAKVCMAFVAGSCKSASQCPLLHTKYCQQYLQTRGFCAKGDACPLKHKKKKTKPKKKEKGQQQSQGATNLVALPSFLSHNKLE